MLQNNAAAERVESENTGAAPLGAMRPRWDSGVRAIRHLFSASEFVGLDRLDRDELEDD